MSRRSMSGNSVTAGDNVDLEQKGKWNETIVSEIYRRIVYVCSRGQNVCIFVKHEEFKNLLYFPQSFLSNMIWTNWDIVFT